MDCSINVNHIEEVRGPKKDGGCMAIDMDDSLNTMWFHADTLAEFRAFVAKLAAAIPPEVKK